MPVIETGRVRNLGMQQPQPCRLGRTCDSVQYTFAVFLELECQVLKRNGQLRVNLPEEYGGWPVGTAAEITE